VDGWAGSGDRLKIFAKMNYLDWDYLPYRIGFQQQSQSLVANIIK
jgi:hypothetical protein